MQITKIFGGAGTGKTTFLIDLLRQKIKEGYSYNDIGFFSFSKSAVNEVKSRAKIPDNVLYFKTLHSLAFHGVGADSKKIYTTDKYSVHNNSFNQLYNFIKSSNCSFSDAQKYLKKNIGFNDYLAGKNSLDKYFAESGSYDFNDILDKYIRQNSFPSFKILFIDEAQDLLPNMWILLKKLIANTSDNVYIAGDDDQTIYTFAGANPLDFIDFKEDKRVILDRNFRNPSNHFELAYNKLLKIKNRVSKKITPIKDKVEINKVSSFDSIIFPKNTRKTTGVLFRHIHDALTFQNYMWTLGRNFISLNGIPAVKMRKFKVHKISTEFPNIHISTIHRMKGREFDRVIYYHKSPDSMNDDERRIMYVALTRSKHSLTIIDEENKFINGAE